jgi:hypothetical protein
MVYRIKNWEKFQHYHKQGSKRLPWIKLYRDLLNDIEWHKLDGESAKALVNLWMLAAEADGALPSAEVIAFRLHTTEKQVLSALSKLGHFLDRQTLPKLYTDGQTKSVEEVEVEVEVEVEEEVEKPPRRFSPPARDDVYAYCQERKNRVNPDAFVDFYESVGWKVGNKPMKDWRAAVRTWEKRDDRGPAGETQGPSVAYERQCEFVGGPRNERCLAKGRNRVGHQWMCSAHSPIR